MDDAIQAELDSATSHAPHDCQNLPTALIQYPGSDCESIYQHREQDRPLCIGHGPRMAQHDRREEQGSDELHHAIAAGREALRACGLDPYDSQDPASTSTDLEIVRKLTAAVVEIVVDRERAHVSLSDWKRSISCGIMYRISFDEDIFAPTLDTKLDAEVTVSFTGDEFQQPRQVSELDDRDVGATRALRILRGVQAARYGRGQAREYATFAQLLCTALLGSHTSPGDNLLYAVVALLGADAFEQNGLGEDSKVRHLWQQQTLNRATNVLRKFLSAN